ncbi:cytochrome c and c1 heme-lyase [Multifurca ochricompacta]|uniref:Holocytochrome c-type synthase n=1 Tax=Multifurca ochricompacta TaxID=376703 RepID=A0AAD4M0V5_9AGAM|nr:cytochrome c and c1 heme-lyase [Multifurca ochricompacta]
MGQVTSSTQHTQHQSSSSSPASCPVDHSAFAKHSQPSSSCPVDHTSLAKHAQSSSSTTSCPVDHSSMSRASSSAPAQCPVQPETLDPRNHLPVLTQDRAPSQTIDLPTERTTSSIPRDAAGQWEYPSPQQFYNALVRKGWETPENEIETMVEIHNFLNEKPGKKFKNGRRKSTSVDEKLQLVRFKGRPGQLSPKARFWLFAGWLLPDRFNTEPPFDRHDWVVRRPSTGEEVRYVIDYYGVPPLPDGSPVFSLDVRPALDSFGSISMRVRAATREAWGKMATEATHT